MNRSLNTSGATSADCSAVDFARPAASNSALGRALTSGRRLRATHPARPWPARTVMPPIASASTPVANRHRNVSASSSNRNSAQPRTARGSRASTRSAPWCRPRPGWCPSSARSRRARRFRDAPARCLRTRYWPWRFRLEPTAGRRVRWSARATVGAASPFQSSSAAASMSAAILTNICTTAGSRARTRFLLQQGERRFGAIAL